MSFSRRTPVSLKAMVPFASRHRKGDLPAHQVCPRGVPAWWTSMDSPCVNPLDSMELWGPSSGRC